MIAPERVAGIVSQVERQALRELSPALRAEFARLSEEERRRWIAQKLFDQLREPDR